MTHLKLTNLVGSNQNSQTMRPQTEKTEHQMKKRLSKKQKRENQLKKQGARKLVKRQFQNVRMEMERLVIRVKVKRQHR